MLARLLIVNFLIGGCSSTDNTPSMDSGSAAQTVPVEPIELPGDAGLFGVPVGRQTTTHNDVALEVWYPTTNEYLNADPQRMNFEDFIPDTFVSLVEGFELPDIYGQAIVNAPVRRTDEKLPIVLFSHGFGGMRIQSFSLAEHMASRGYVVIAADHPGRMLTDVLPCLFSPPLEGCDLSGFGSDPGPEGLAAALAWADFSAIAGPFSNLIDTTRVATIGHSAGANSVTSFTNTEERIQATIPMAGGSVPTRDVPTLRIDGNCDGFVAAASPESVDGFPQAQFIMLEGAGHLAFSDLCSLDIDGFSTRFLDERDDLNTALYPQLRGLGTDGCPSAEPRVEEESCTDAFLSLENSNSILKYYVTVFLDQALKGVDSTDGRTFGDATVY